MPTQVTLQDVAVNLFANQQIGLQSFSVFKREYNQGLYSIETFYLSSQLAHFTQEGVLIIFNFTLLYWVIGFYDAASNFFLYLLINGLNYLIWVQISLMLVPITSLTLILTVAGSMQIFFVFFFFKKEHSSKNV